MDTNIFDLLGINAVDVVAESTKKNVKENATTSTNNTKSAKDTKSNKEIKFNVENGITIYTGFYEPLFLSRDTFSNNEVEAKEICTSLCTHYREFAPSLCSVELISDSDYVVYFNTNSKLSPDRIIEIGDNDWCIRLADFEISISDIEDSKTITYESVKSIWVNQYPEFKNCDFICDETHHIIVPILKGEAVKKISTPAEFHLFGNESFILDDNKFKIKPELSESSLNDFSIFNAPLADTVDFSSEGSEKSSEEVFDSEEEDGEEESDAESSNSKDSSYNIETIYSKLIEKYPIKLSKLKGYFSIINLNDNYYIWPSSIKKSNEVKGKKEESYPVEGTTLSLAFIRYELNPSMFKGKQLVTKKDLIEFLSDDHPEYSDGRTTFEYSKKDKLLVAYLTGSRKGAFVSSLEEQSHYIRQPYSIQKYTANNHTYRIENTPVGLFVSGDDIHCGEFTFHLPKIPSSILKEIHDYFYQVNQYGIKNYSCNLEAACQLFFDKTSKQYFVYYPRQVVSKYYVDYIRNVHLEHSQNMILVMDIHSHHSMDAIFSEDDNEDEKGTRLYGVMGKINENYYELSLRAGTGGLFIPLSRDTIFINDNSIPICPLDIDWDRIEVKYKLSLAI